MSPTLKSTGGGSLWAKFGKDGLTDVSQILTRSGRHGAVICKRNCVAIFGRLSTMYECDRQTDKHIDRSNNGNIDRIRQNCLRISDVA